MKIHIKNIFRLIGCALVLFGMEIPLQSAAETEVYGAPEGVDCSSDFAVTIDGQEAFVFYVSENGLRNNYLPGADITIVRVGKIVVRNTVSDPSKVVIKKARESWVSFETEKSTLIRVGQLADPLPMENVLLIDELGNAVKYEIDGKQISFTATAGHK